MCDNMFIFQIQSDFEPDHDMESSPEKSHKPPSSSSQQQTNGATKSLFKRTLDNPSFNAARQKLAKFDELKNSDL